MIFDPILFEKITKNTLAADTSAPVTYVPLYCFASGMLAVALDNFTISVVDIETRRVVRDYQGHTNTVTGMVFSADGRWLISASMDSTVRTWDLPTAR